jgi:phosphoglycerate dehydrogenase-like enzyme
MTAPNWIALGLMLATSAAAAAAQPAPLDLAAAQAEFQLIESARPVKELIPGWRAPRNLLVVVDKPERTAWLQEAMPKGVKVTGAARDAELVPLLPEADALVEANCNATAGNAPKLMWLHASSGGSDMCLAIPRIANGEVLLTNSQKVKNSFLAEIGMGYVLGLARALDVTLDNQRHQDVNRAGGRKAKRLEGATMLIVGLGGAGTEIARMAHAMGMKVVATDPVNKTPPDFVSRVGMPEELPGMIGQADVVMVAAPLTSATRGMFNKALFARMKPDAIFVNWARADIVVADDLAAALKAGTIGSAALNWATNTPLTKDNPLWSAPNLILAPWAGASTSGAREVSAETVRINELHWFMVRENMRRFAVGEKMYSVFDLARGY